MHREATRWIACKPNDTNDSSKGLKQIILLNRSGSLCARFDGAEMSLFIVCYRHLRVEHLCKMNAMLRIVTHQIHTHTYSILNIIKSYKYITSPQQFSSIYIEMCVLTLKKNWLNQMLFPLLAYLFLRTTQNISYFLLCMSSLTTSLATMVLDGCKHFLCLSLLHIHKDIQWMSFTYDNTYILSHTRHCNWNHMCVLIYSVLYRILLLFVSHALAYIMDIW